MKYQDLNSEIIDKWCENDWEWGKIISHEKYVDALNGKWDVVLTPLKMCRTNGLVI